MSQLHFEHSKANKEASGNEVMSSSEKETMVCEVDCYIGELAGLRGRTERRNSKNSGRRRKGRRRMMFYVEDDRRIYSAKRRLFIRRHAPQPIPGSASISSSQKGKTDLLSLPKPKSRLGSWRTWVRNNLVLAMNRKKTGY